MPQPNLTAAVERIVMGLSKLFVIVGILAHLWLVANRWVLPVEPPPIYNAAANYGYVIWSAGMLEYHYGKRDGAANGIPTTK